MSFREMEELPNRFWKWLSDESSYYLCVRNTPASSTSQSLTPRTPNRWQSDLLHFKAEEWVKDRRGWCPVAWLASLTLETGSPCYFTFSLEEPMVRPREWAPDQGLALLALSCKRQEPCLHVGVSRVLTNLSQTKRKDVCFVFAGTDGFQLDDKGYFWIAYTVGELLYQFVRIW